MSRDNKDYALEFAEYLAIDAEHLMKVFDTVLRTHEEVLDLDDGDRDSLNDAFRALRNSIFEFRKRVSRCVPGT
jgi:hypothetical protein